MHLYIFGLTHPISPVGGLILHSRVPPAVKVEDMIGCGQIQSHAAGLDGQNEDGRLLVLRQCSGLEFLNHAVPCRLGGAPVQIQHRFLQLLTQYLLQHLSHTNVLGENQASLALVP
ncbi:hypothetical protein D3C74_418260 [compost metagenome]